MGNKQSRCYWVAPMNQNCQQMISVHLITWRGPYSYFTDVRIKADEVEEDWMTATAVHLPVLENTVSRGVAEDHVQIHLQFRWILSWLNLNNFLYNIFSNSINFVKKKIEALLYAHKAWAQCHFYSLGKLGVVKSLRKKNRFKAWKERRITKLSTILATRLGTFSVFIISFLLQ